MRGNLWQRGRRSLLVDGMSLLAGAWLALAGGAVLGAACGSGTPSAADMTAPGDAATDGPVVKYGGPPDAAVMEDMPVVKYGGPADLATPLG